MPLLAQGLLTKGYSFTHKQVNAPSDPRPHPPPIQRRAMLHMYRQECHSAIIRPCLKCNTASHIHANETGQLETMSHGVHYLVTVCTTGPRMCVQHNCKQLFLWGYIGAVILRLSTDLIHHNSCSLLIMRQIYVESFVAFRCF